MVKKGKFGVPDRWFNYTAIGNQIKGLPIIPCKVPLTEMFIYNNKHISWPREEWFTPKILMQKVPNIGCIVDLTATNRYYNSTDFTLNGIHYQKVFCEGHVIPKPQTVKRFFWVLDQFLHSDESRGKVLMVHCTHGLNRTGYLVSRYMVERRGYKPQDAIAAFNEARGHTIERDNYLNDLENRGLLEGSEPLPAEDWWSQGSLPGPFSRSLPGPFPRSLPGPHHLGRKMEMVRQQAQAISLNNTDEDRGINNPTSVASNQPNSVKKSKKPKKSRQQAGSTSLNETEQDRGIKNPTSGASHQPNSVKKSRQQAQSTTSLNETEQDRDIMNPTSGPSNQPNSVKKPRKYRHQAQSNLHSAQSTTSLKSKATSSNETEQDRGINYPKSEASNQPSLVKKSEKRPRNNYYDNSQRHKMIQRDFASNYQRDHSRERAVRKRNDDSQRYGIDQRESTVRNYQRYPSRERAVRKHNDDSQRQGNTSFRGRDNGYNPGRWSISYAPSNALQQRHHHRSNQPPFHNRFKDDRNQGVHQSNGGERQFRSTVWRRTIHSKDPTATDVIQRNEASSL